MTQETNPAELTEKYSHIPSLQTMANLEEIQQPQFDNQPQKIEEQQYKSATRIYIKCFCIGMGSVFFGYQMSVLNLAQDQLNEVYGLKDNLELLKGIFASCLFVGAFFGSMTAESLLNKFGERKVSMICDIAAIILSLFFLIPNFVLAVTIRTLIGAVVGINAALVPPFILQISPKEITGFTGCFTSVFIASGIFYGICMGQGFPTDEQELEKKEDFWWRFVLVSPIIFCFIRLFTITFIYKLETAIFYVQKGQQELAVKALDQIYKKEYIQQQLEILNESLKNNNNGDNEKQTWSSLFNKENRDLTFLGVNLFVILQFTGITAVIFYSSTIFENATGDKDTGNIVNIVAMGIFSLMPLVGGEICKRSGRKPMMIVGKSALSIILLLIGVFTWVYNENEGEDGLQNVCSICNIILIFAYLMIFNSTEGAALWVIPAEILSPKQMSLCTVVYNFTSFFVGFIFPVAEKAFGIEPIFIFFAIILVPSIMYENKRLKETKGLNRLEIEELYRKKDHM